MRIYTSFPIFNNHLSPRQKDLAKDSINSLKIIPVRYASNDNLIVDSVYLESPFLISGTIEQATC